MGQPGNPGNDKVIGILGGMGPHATLLFQRNVLDLTGAAKDWDHVRTVCDSNTHVPSRSRAVLYGEESPLPAMLDSCRRLQAYPVDLIVIPCNSACHWVPELRRAIKTPIANIAAVATRVLLEGHAVSRVAILGGMVPYLTDLYPAEIERFGATCVKPPEDLQETIVSLIERIKLSGSASGLAGEMTAVITRLARDERVDGVILGCTEFTEFRTLAVDGVRLVDSSTALAQLVVDFAVRGKPLPVDVKTIEAFWRSRADRLRSGELGVLQSTMLTASEDEATARDEQEKAALFGVLTPLLNPDGTMLEIGCGLGRWTRALSPHVAHVDAYDYSAELIEQARELSRDTPNIAYRCAPVEAIRPARQYDHVVSIALLHYLNDEQWDKAIDLVRLSTAPGGLAIFRESFGCDRRFELHGFYSTVLQAEYHAVYRTTKELADRMGSAFTCVHEDTSLPSTAEKPETCQKIVIFRRRK